MRGAQKIPMITACFPATVLCAANPQTAQARNPFDSFQTGSGPAGSPQKCRNSPIINFHGNVWAKCGESVAKCGNMCALKATYDKQMHATCGPAVKISSDSDSDSESDSDSDSTSTSTSTSTAHFFGQPLRRAGAVPASDYYGQSAY